MSDIGADTSVTSGAGLAEPVSIKQKTMAFIRWRKSRGYEVAPCKRKFWGKKAWKP